MKFVSMSPVVWEMLLLYPLFSLEKSIHLFCTKVGPSSVRPSVRTHEWTFVGCFKFQRFIVYKINYGINLICI